jgi:hypothetical protein
LFFFLFWISLLASFQKNIYFMELNPLQVAQKNWLPTNKSGEVVRLYDDLVQSKINDHGSRAHQVAEAALHDKDPEWLQAQGTGSHPNKERTTQQAKWDSDTTRTIQCARATSN